MNDVPLSFELVFLFQWNYFKRFVHCIHLDGIFYEQAPAYLRVQFRGKSPKFKESITAYFL